MERTLEVRTGESVDIRYELAGIGSRFLAVVLDLAIQVGITLGVLVLLAVLSRPLVAAPARLAPAEFTKTIEAVVGALGVFAIFVLYFGYFIVFELWWSGRTPGKRALGIRVMRDAGFPIDVGAAVTRNLVRVLEFALGFYAVSAVSALVSRENKRLGDLAAGTIVVRDRRYEAASIDAYMAREASAADGLGAAEHHLIGRYMSRRAQLEPRARAAVAHEIAGRVRPHLRASFDFLGDDELLEHLGRAGPKPQPESDGP